MPLNTKAIYKNLNLIIVLFIFIFVGAGFYFIKPMYDAWQEKKAAKDSVLLEKDEIQKKLEENRALLAKYEGIKEKLNSLSLSLPTERDIPNLLVQLEALAVNNQVLMEEVSYEEEKQESPIPTQTSPQASGETNVAPGASEEGESASAASQDGYATLEITMSLLGTYDSFQNYLNDLQENLRFLDIVSVDFDASDSSSGNQSGQEEEEKNFADYIMQYNVILKTYYLK